MDPTEIERKIREILTSLCGIPADADANADLYLDLGVASFHALQLLQELEEQFDVHIPDDEFVEATSISRLTASIGVVLNGIRSDA